MIPPCSPLLCPLRLENPQVLAPLFRYLRRLIAVSAVMLLAGGVARADSGFHVVPGTVTLDGAFARAQLLVATVGAPEKADDLTNKASYASSNPQVVTVSANGQLLARTNGDAVVSVTHAGQSQSV